MISLINDVNFKDEVRTIFVGVEENNNPMELEKIINQVKAKKDIFKFGEITTVYPLEDFKSNRIVFVGLGKKENYNLLEIETLFSKIGKDIQEESIIYLDSFSILHQDIHYLCEKLIETIKLVKYQFNNYKKDKNDVKEMDITVFSKFDVAKDIEFGAINAEGTNNARSLVNEPRNKMTPSILAQYAKTLAEEFKLDYKIYNKSEIETLGMGAFLAVNQGSIEEAKLIHIKYRNAKHENVTALVGKGLTYDSGGYSIKPKNGMAGMKGDMGGAASVLGAFEIICRKALKVNVDVIIAATENLINAEAIVPDDVVVTMNGKTIEILNTDAEGRLTLVDAVTFAKRNHAAEIIDVATLTGGVVTALGKEITGAFTNNRSLIEKIKASAEKTGEMIWELPVDQFRKRCKKSNVADYNNSPGRDGHASFAAALIAEFVEDTPWVHLDIAGTSAKESAYLLGPAGGTGVMVRTLANYFEKQNKK